MMEEGYNIKSTSTRDTRSLAQADSEEERQGEELNAFYQLVPVTHL